MKILACLGLVCCIGTACAAQNNYEIPTSIQGCIDSGNNICKAIGMIALEFNDGDELAAIRFATDVTRGILNSPENSFTTEERKKYSIDFFDAIYKDDFVKLITNFISYLQICYKNIAEDHKSFQELVNQSTNFAEFINWLNNQSIRIDLNGKITIGSTTLKGNYAEFAKNQRRFFMRGYLEELLGQSLTENVLSLLDKTEYPNVKPDFTCLITLGYQAPESVKAVSELLEEYQMAVTDY